MSKIARSYSDKHGLKDLVKEFTGNDISKTLQSSDFGGDLSENNYNIVLRMLFISMKFMKG